MSKNRCYLACDLPQTPPTWLAANHLTHKSLAFLAGNSGHGKSFWAVDLACSIAYGYPFLGRYQVDHGHVAYIAGEGGAGLDKRIRGWKQTRGLTVDRAHENLIVCYHAVNMGVEMEVVDLMQDIEDTRPEIQEDPPKLLIIDTLNRCFWGDENSSQECNQFLKSVALMQDTWECAALILHHMPYDARRMRGSTAWTAAADSIFVIEREGAMSLVENTKQKDWEVHPPYYLESERVILSAGPPVIDTIVYKCTKDPTANEKYKDLAKLLQYFAQPNSIAKAALAAGIPSTTAKRLVLAARNHSPEPYLVQEAEGFLLTPHGAHLVATFRQ